MLCCNPQKLTHYLCSIFIPQFSCFANELALLWVNSKHVKFGLQILALLKRKDQHILIEQSAF